VANPSRDRWFPARWGAAAWWSTGIAFVLLAVAVAHGSTTSLDARVTKTAVQHRTAALTHLASVVSWFGLAAVLALWAGGIAVGLDRYYRRSWRCTLSVLVVLLLDVVVVAGIKHLVDRPRPPLDIRLVSVSTRSFPSGHAAATAAAVAMLLLCLVALPSSRRVRVRSFIAGAVLVVAMDWSRVYLGVHFLSDVAAGTLLGCWLALSTTWVLDVLRQPRTT
jgi:undecaprenyl-diphosphatase